MYLSGDANNGDNFFPTMQQAEDALTFIREEDDTPERGFKSVNVVALWDGPEGANDYVHSDPETRLLELGRGFHDFDGDGTDSGKYGNSKNDWSLSSNTRDLSSVVDWIVQSDGKQEVNMGSVKTLTNFLTWINNHYRGDEVIILFGDHGAGPAVEVDSENSKWYSDDSRAIMIDSDTNGEDGSPALRICDIISALNDSGFKGDNKPDLIIEDLCYGGTIEEAYGLKGAAHYFMASPNYTRGNSMGAYHFITGFNKGSNLKLICRDEIANFAKKWPGYDEADGSSTFSLIDLSQTDAFEGIKNNLSLLAEQLLSDEEKYEPVISLIKNKEKQTGLVFKATYVYLKEMGWLLDQIDNDYSEFPELAEYTGAIKENLSKVVVCSFASARYYTGHEGEAYNCYSNDRKKNWQGTYATEKWYGLAVSVTQQTKILDLDNKVIDYENCTPFGENNKWGELLRK